jgi:hypothetical protein
MREANDGELQSAVRKMLANKFFQSLLYTLVFLESLENI